jgi:hypothetical protein
MEGGRARVMTRWWMRSWGAVQNDSKSATGKERRAKEIEDRPANSLSPLLFCGSNGTKLLISSPP